MTALVVAGPAHANDFQGDYALANWSSSGITGGTADVDLANSTLSTGVFVYDVNLGNPGGGVTNRTATFSMVAPASTQVSVDWAYDGSHAWFQAEAELTFFAFDATGTRQDVVVFDQGTSGAFAGTGMVANLDVYAGQAWGFEVGGNNFDSNAFLRGTVTLTNLVYDNLDCNGVPNGPATLDNCGTCDDNPANDCVQDCAGTWGGEADEDACGTCDDDPSNDCEQDCAGTWGGAASTDMCGTCDDDATNDCEQDCHGDWGGTAAVDVCDVCSGGNTGIPVDDCVRESGDSDEPGGGIDETDPRLQDTDPFNDIERSEGCACQTGPAPRMGGWWLLAGALVWRRRRGGGDAGSGRYPSS